MMTVNTLPTDYRLMNQCETNAFSEGRERFPDVIQVRASVSGYDTDLAMPVAVPEFHSITFFCDDE